MKKNINFNFISLFLVFISVFVLITFSFSNFNENIFKEDVLTYESNTEDKNSDLVNKEPYNSDFPSNQESFFADLEVNTEYVETWLYGEPDNLDIDQQSASIGYIVISYPASYNEIELTETSIYTSDNSNNFLGFFREVEAGENGYIENKISYYLFFDEIYYNQNLDLGYNSVNLRFKSNATNKFYNPIQIYFGNDKLDQNDLSRQILIKSEINSENYNGIFYPLTGNDYDLIVQLKNNPPNGETVWVNILSYKREIEQNISLTNVVTSEIFQVELIDNIPGGENFTLNDYDPVSLWSRSGNQLRSTFENTIRFSDYNIKLFLTQSVFLTETTSEPHDLDTLFKFTSTYLEYFYPYPFRASAGNANPPESLRFDPADFNNDTVTVEQDSFDSSKGTIRISYDSTKSSTVTGVYITDNLSSNSDDWFYTGIGFDGWNDDNFGNIEFQTDIFETPNNLPKTYYIIVVFSNYYANVQELPNEPKEQSNPIPISWKPFQKISSNVAEVKNSNQIFVDMSNYSLNLNSFNNENYLIDIYIYFGIAYTSSDLSSVSLIRSDGTKVNGLFTEVENDIPNLYSKKYQVSFGSNYNSLPNERINNIEFGDTYTSISVGYDNNPDSADYNPEKDEAVYNFDSFEDPDNISFGPNQPENIIVPEYDFNLDNQYYSVDIQNKTSNSADVNIIYNSGIYSKTNYIVIYNEENINESFTFTSDDWNDDGNGRISFSTGSIFTPGTDYYYYINYEIDFSGSQSSSTKSSFLLTTDYDTTISSNNPFFISQINSTANSLYLEISYNDTNSKLEEIYFINTLTNQEFIFNQNSWNDNNEGKITFYFNQFAQNTTYEIKVKYSYFENGEITTQDNPVDIATVNGGQTSSVTFQNSSYVELDNNLNIDFSNSNFNTYSIENIQLSFDKIFDSQITSFSLVSNGKNYLSNNWKYNTNTGTFTLNFYNLDPNTVYNALSINYIDENGAELNLVVNINALTKGENVNISNDRSISLELAIAIIVLGVILLLLLLSIFALKIRKNSSN